MNWRKKEYWTEYILSLIGNNYLLMFMTENSSMVWFSWIKLDVTLSKTAVEMKYFPSDTSTLYCFRSGFQVSFKTWRIKLFSFLDPRWNFRSTPSVKFGILAKPISELSSKISSRSSVSLRELKCNYLFCCESNLTLLLNYNM